MKIKKITTVVFTALAVGVSIISGVMKLSAGADVIKMLDLVGVGQYRSLLGMAEIVFAALFAFPKTMKIGFLLLASYFAGAMATEVSHQLTLNALTPLVLIWVAAALRDQYIFLPTSKPDQL